MGWVFKSEHPARSSAPREVRSALGLFDCNSGRKARHAMTSHDIIEPSMKPEGIPESGD